MGDRTDEIQRRLSALLISKAAPLVPAAGSIERLLAATRRITARKGETLLRAGDVAEVLLFVAAGLVRYVYIDPASGEERTGQFFAEDSVVTDAASFLTASPGTQTFVAVEASVLLLIPRAALLRAYDEDHAIERFGRKLIEGALIGAQRRSAALLNLTPDERYRRFIETRPDIARRVPQYLLASHLGITPESLSRIRGRLSRRAKD